MTHLIGRPKALANVIALGVRTAELVGRAERKEPGARDILDEEQDDATRETYVWLRDARGYWRALRRELDRVRFGAPARN